MFANYAGCDDHDDAIAEELLLAGVTVRRTNHPQDGEVQTKVMGALYGWTFHRAWRYWIVQGPGLPLSYAMPLHKHYGTTVRVDGHAGAPSPLEQFHGFARNHYHVDDAIGLTALVVALKQCVFDNALSRLDSIGEQAEAQLQTIKQLTHSDIGHC